MSKSDNNFRDIEAYRLGRYRAGSVLWWIDWLIMFPMLQVWAWKRTTSMGLDYLGDRKLIEQDIRQGAFFMTNHRDIILDAAWLSYRLATRYGIRPYIGIGNNLFARKWIEWAVRINRCFVVKRGAGIHEHLNNAKHLSAYIRMLRNQGESIWLAQREGRAKDSNDCTQPSVLHMLTLLDEGDFFENVKALNICPVSINYEYDPCDYLKAREMQLKRDNPHWRKTKKDDVESMLTGIRGEKGRVVYRLTRSINPDIDTMLAAHPEYRELNNKEQIEKVCQIIDCHIHQGYEIYERGTKFDAYIESRLALIDIPDKDEQFLREKLYEMYNNPVKNYEKSYIPREF